MPPRKGPNSAHLRDAIDRGRTGSKVPARDPSAAPLGTDDEAAGTPPTTEEVKMALRHEVLNRARHRPDGKDAIASRGVRKR